MTIDVVATSDFIHGKLEMSKRGEASLPEQLAKDLQAAGLVVLANHANENEAAPAVANKMAPPARNKGGKSSKARPDVIDADTRTGASADVCTEKPGVLVGGAQQDLNAPQAAADTVSLADGGGSAGPAGLAADVAAA
ncbi:hypothetical protein [Janthinobacterium sp. P210005]|uniref:hypothetical protein n=1 Tax=Janthinobacterium sp. P210005 TaxID=3112938 RepID=UPI002E254F28|nr:hypothetical protein [Janthinobacterium sp. P210005]